MINLIPPLKSSTTTACGKMRKRGGGGRKEVNGPNQDYHFLSIMYGVKVAMKATNSISKRGMRHELYRFSGTVRPDDQSQGLEEGDDVLVFRVEAPDALYQHFVYSTHLSWLPFSLQDKWHAEKERKSLINASVEERGSSSEGRWENSGDEEGVGFERE